GRGRTANGDGHDESYIVSTILNSLASLPSHVSRLTSFDSYTLTAACSHPTNSTTATTLPQRGQLRHTCAALPTDANATTTTSVNTAARAGEVDAGTSNQRSARPMQSATAVSASTGWNRAGSASNAVRRLIRRHA